MNAHILRIAAALAIPVLSAAGALAECPPVPPGEDPFVRERFIIGVADYATPAEAFAAIEQLFPGATVVDEIANRGFYLMQPPPSVLDCDLVEELIVTLVNATPTVPDPARPLKFAELNYEGGSPEGHTGTIFINTAPEAGAIRYQNQYATTMIGVQAAQARSTGRGVAVAVVDTGIDAAHPQLAGRIRSGYNCFTNDNQTSDPTSGAMAGHGTFVAGLIAAVAPDARIVPVVALDADGRSDQFTVAKAIYYAIDCGVEVINLSLGSTSEAELILEATHEARHLGIVVVASIGNRAAEYPHEFPGASGDLIAVAATDENDVLDLHSSFGHDVFICAPGASATLPDGSPDPNRAIFSTVPGDAYGAWGGTSFATAIVSGSAALIRSQHPEWYSRSQTAEDIEATLAQTAVSIDAQNPDQVGLLGAGRLDLEAAVAEGPPTPGIGDLDGDGHVGLSDLARLLRDYGSVHSTADIDAGGSVDLTDLALLLSHFGE